MTADFYPFTRAGSRTRRRFGDEDGRVRVIRPGHARRDLDFYATKDRAMSAAATVA